MEWRECFEEQWGEFNELELKRNIKRVQKLEREEEGEAMVYRIIKGTDVTDQFIKDQK